MSEDLRAKYVGNLVPEGAEKRPTPEGESWKDVQVFALGSIGFLANLAGVVTEVWDEGVEENPEAMTLDQL